MEGKLPTSRAYRLAWDLCEGKRYTTEQAAEILNITHQGAEVQLMKACLEVPITRINGWWQRAEKGKPAG